MSTHATPAYKDNASTLRFLTAGSVDDGKSTLIGRLLFDSKAILADQLSGIQHKFSDDESYDLAKLTDGLQAEREQGITIDVAYRYFATPDRKFIIADAPGHEQYTRNMVTAASNSDAAVILVDATKLDWQSSALELLPQTKRHTLLANLLKVPSILFAINKLDAVTNPKLAFVNIKQALEQFIKQADIKITHIIPVSALKGLNVTASHQSDTDRLFGKEIYQGPSLLDALTELPSQHASLTPEFHFPVQYVQKLQNGTPNPNQHGQRIFWGKIHAGTVRPNDSVLIHPSGLTAKIVKIFANASQHELGEAYAGQSVGLILDQEIDVSRGDWITSTTVPSFKKEIQATLAWLDDEALVIGRAYWFKQGHRWIKAKIAKVNYQLNIHNLAKEPADHLEKNDIGQITLQLQQSIPAITYNNVKAIGSAILVDSATNRTAGAILIEE